MSGGRSPSEKGLSKRGMFLQLKQKLKTAAEAPGFFQVGEGEPVSLVYIILQYYSHKFRFYFQDVELYCKSNRDGTQIGDCPFAQFIQLVLLKKGIRYSVHPTLSSQKPAWLVEKHEGKLPALFVKGAALTDSLAIAEFIEKTYPQNSLTRQGAFSYQEVLEKTAGFFPALSGLIQNKDESKDEALIAAIETQFDIIDEILRSTPGQYLCGLELTLADLYLLPQLFHAMVTLDHFKGVEFYHIEGDPTRPALESYLARLLDMEEFNNKKVYYNVDQVIYGWKVARGEV